MFTCSRCGTGFNATVAATVENCPRCHSRDGVENPLTFKLFRTPAAALGAEIVMEKTTKTEVEAQT